MTFKIAKSNSCPNHEPPHWSGAGDVSTGWTAVRLRFFAKSSDFRPSTRGPFFVKMIDSRPGLWVIGAALNLPISTYFFQCESVMYAIISDGGRQFQVKEGDELTIDYRDGVAEGAEIVFDRILAAGSGADLKFGKPVLSGASVKATVINPEAKGPKLVIQKFRRRKNSKRKTGHRQVNTTVKIGAISV